MISRRAIVSSRAYLLVLALIPAAAAWSGVAGCSGSNSTTGHGDAGGGGAGGGLGGGGGLAGGGGSGIGGGGGSEQLPDASSSDTASPDAPGDASDAAPGTDGPSGDDARDAPADAPAVAPTITMLTPASAHVGDPGFTLIVEGHDFPSTPRVSFDGNLFNTSVVSATRVQAQIPSAALGATPRQVPVLVTRIGSPPATSNVLSFAILAAQGQDGASND